MNTQQINIVHKNVSILKKKMDIFIYIYNPYTYYIIKVNNKLQINIQNSYHITIKNPYINPAVFVTNNILQNFINQFSEYKYVKIKFTGKGYKIKKNTQQSLVFLFNRAHITNIWWTNIILRKLKKYKIYIRSITQLDTVVNKILGIRPINIFTKRGLRVARQIVFKKKGKK